MSIWRTANLITRAFTSEATQDWLTGTTIMLSSNRDTYKSQGSATMEHIACDSSKPNIPESLSLTSKDTSLGTVTLQRSRSGETGAINEAAGISTTGPVIETPHERGERAEQGRLPIVVGSNSVDIRVKRESPGYVSVTDEQPIPGSNEGISPPLRTLRTKRGFRKPVNARESIFGPVSRNSFEPAESRLHVGDAPTLPDVQKTRVSLFPKEESSGDPSDSELHDGAPLYFQKWMAFNSDGDHAEAYLQLDDEASRRCKPGSDFYALRESPKIETSELLPSLERPQDVISALEKEPKNGFPTKHGMDTSTDVVDREDTRKTEMNETGTMPEGVPGTAPANDCSNVKESAPSTKDSADVSHQTSPRKIRLKDKIRGEMKVLTGKLGNKIAAGKKMMGKVV